MCKKCTLQILINQPKLPKPCFGNFNELSPKATVSILETVQKEGKRSVSRRIEIYNPDVEIKFSKFLNLQNAR